MKATKMRRVNGRANGTGHASRAVCLVALALTLAVPILLRGQVTYDDILRAGKRPGDWLTYSGNYASHRHSPLGEITRANVEKLRPAWVYQTGVTHKFQTTPIVADGVMYISEPPSNVTALDTRTGRPLWRYHRRLPDDVRACCGQVNRGVALLDGMVYIGTVDAHLVALDARTGAVRWEVAAADYRTGHAMTGAPLAVKGLIVIGIAGGEFGIRGFLDAYDAKTGRRAWRFWTVPAPGEPGSETWRGDSWKTGAVPTWGIGAFDPELNTLYWGTGNPGPLFDGGDRAGDNLYSNSLLALDADTGRLKWHFQFTPHDVHDWDSTQTPVLATGTHQERARKVALFANRNGFYYVLDRVTGEYLGARAFVKQTWAKGIDGKGRPIPAPGREPTVEGTITYPSVPGAVNYFSPSYSPITRLFYVAAREGGSVFYKGKTPYASGQLFVGGSFQSVPKDDEYGAVRALDPMTGALVWEQRLFSPGWSGLLSTAGGLVFGGTNEGDFYAFDDKTGALLWRFQTGGAALGNPMSYAVDGKQYIAAPAGASLYVFSLD